ncbi:MAG: barstar family protein [Oscillospiraceae bacterium]|nr:barstar family protein [Oscillospiraceae bacterium]
MNVVLDGRGMTDRKVVHDELKKQLMLPDYYGRNLDALFDVLTERREPMTVTVTYWTDMEVQLGAYAAALLDTLYDAERENPNLKIVVKRES